MSAEVLQMGDDDIFLEAPKVDLVKRLQGIIKTADALVVDNEDAFNRITTLYADSKDWENRIEFARKQANGPDQDRINARNDKAKEILGPLRALQSIARSKSSQYQAHLEEVKQRENQAVLDAIAILGIEDAPYLPPVEKTHRGEGAVVYTRLVKKFRVTDLKLVPLEYLQLNEKLVQKNIESGREVIPGIEVFSEKVTQLKTR